MRGTMPKKDKPEKSEAGQAFSVGDHIKVKLHDARTVDATIRAVVLNGKETKLQVDYGHGETALIALWQILK
jgi:hypothetical protein